MSTINYHFQCPVCRKTTVQEFVSIRNMPVHCNLLWPDREASMKAPLGDIVLVYCSSCGHVANSAFDATLTEYTQAYENSLHFSPRFQEFARSQAEDLVDRYNLRQRELVEIGAGQGDFLGLLCERGDNRGLGFDEAYMPEGQDEQDERFKIINEFAWQEYIESTPDMIYARHVLEHIEHPSEFVSVIRQVIGDNADTLVYLEVPNMAYTLRELAIWDIIYEHCGYFTPQSLTCLLSQGGFGVLQTREVFGGQFLTIEAKPAEEFTEKACVEQNALASLEQQIYVFAEAYEQKVAYWRKKLAAWQKEGKRVVTWGAGSKGVTFLNIMQAKDIVSFIVDINPRKLGKYVVGTGQEIVSPQFLRDYQPDVVILMNPLYQDEIARTLKDMGVTAEIIVA